MNPRLINPSEELREKNFTLFKSVYGFTPGIDQQERDKYYMTYAQNDEPVLYIKNAAPCGDLRMNSLYDPGYEAHKWAEKSEAENRKADILVCGFSTGAFVKALRNKYRFDTDIYVFEPLEGLFSYVCACTDITDIISDKKVHLIISGEQKAKLVDVMQNEILTYKSEVLRIITPFYSEDEDFMYACDQVSRISSALRNYKDARGRNALRCRMYAWNHMESARFLKDIEKKMPGESAAVIVSAGPSLNKNVDVLKSFRNHAFILSTDRALSVLQKHGIVPDAAISIDAEKSADFLNYAFEKNVPVIASFQLNTEAQKRCRFPIFFDGIKQEAELFGNDKVSGIPFDMGGNVAGAAFVALKQLGIKTMILIGQDLAYSNGKHHADNLQDGMENDSSEDYVEVPGVNGDTVTSNSLWIKFRDFFVRQIKQNPDIRVIDATEGGALIEGSEVMTLMEAYNLVKEETYDFRKMIEEVPVSLGTDWKEKVQEKVEKWAQELSVIEKNSKELGELCKELADICEKDPDGLFISGNKIKRFDELRSGIYKLEMNYLLEEFWVGDVYLIPERTLVLDNSKDAAVVFGNSGKFFEQLVGDSRSLREELLNATFGD